MSDELKETMHNHRLWLDSQGIEGKQANLAYKDLRQVQLSDIVFDKAILIGVNFERAILTNVSFEETDLQNANFGYAEVQNSNFMGSNLYGTNFIGATLKGSDFTRALCDEVIFESANLTHTQFYKANGVNVKFNQANLSFAQMQEARFIDGLFLATNFNQAVLQNTDFKGGRFNKANFSGAFFQNTSMTHGDIRQSSFMRVNLTEGHFQSTYLDKQTRNTLLKYKKASSLMAEEEVKITKKKFKLEAPLSIEPMGSKPNYRDILREKDELNFHFNSIRPQSYFNLTIKEKQNLKADGEKLKKQIEEIENKEQIARLEIERDKETAAELQASLEKRVDYANYHFKLSLRTINAHIRRLVFWSFFSKVVSFALISIGLTALVFSYFFQKIELTQAQMLLGMGLILAGILFYWIDRTNPRDLEPMLKRKYIIENTIAILASAKALSMDMNKNFDEVNKSFELARQALLKTDLELEF